MSDEVQQRPAMKARAMETLRSGRLAKWVLLSGALGVMAGVIAWLFRELTRVAETTS